jgi:hypothetical protein
MNEKDEVHSPDQPVKMSTHYSTHQPDIFKSMLYIKLY